jgi:hypothetical protein
MAAPDSEPVDRPKAESSSKQSRPSLSQSPDEYRIARLAYELFLRRGGEHGHDQEDWFKAQRQLNSTAHD